MAAYINVKYIPLNFNFQECINAGATVLQIWTHSHVLQEADATMSCIIRQVAVLQRWYPK